MIKVQCAWCKREWAKPGSLAGVVQGVSHSICESCKIEVLKGLDITSGKIPTGK